MTIVGVLILVSIVAAIVYFRNYFRLVIATRHLKGPKTVFFFGNAFILQDPDVFKTYGDNAYRWFGRIMMSWVSIVPFIWIFEPDHLKIILGSSKVSKKSIIYDMLHNFLGRGLLTNNGDIWKRHRKLIQPYFTLNILETYIESFDKHAKKFVDTLPYSKDIKITTVINECVLNILSESILGISLDPKSPYRSGEVVLTERLSKPWLMVESIFNMTNFSKKETQQKMSLYSYTEQILRCKRKTFDRNNITSLMDRFIEISENNPVFTDENIINETVTFMLAGQDSVGATLAFTIFFLAKYPEVQQKAHAEIVEFIHNDKITLQDLNNLKYLEMVIKESLRITPTVPIMSRVLTEEVVLDGITFPKGTNMGMSAYVTHRIPHHFPNPDVFDPERFSPENVEKMHPYAFIPFSAGPRNCLGYKFAILEIKTVLMNLLQKYELTLREDKQDYNLAFRGTLRARGGIWAKFNPRGSDINTNNNTVAA